MSLLCAPSSGRIGAERPLTTHFWKKNQNSKVINYKSYLLFIYCNFSIKILYCSYYDNSKEYSGLQHHHQLGPWPSFNTSFSFNSDLINYQLFFTLQSTIFVLLRYTRNWYNCCTWILFFKNKMETQKMETQNMETHFSFEPTHKHSQNLIIHQ